MVGLLVVTSSEGFCRQVMVEVFDCLCWLFAFFSSEGLRLYREEVLDGGISS